MHRNNILIAVIVVAIALCIFFYAWRTPHSQQPALSVGALAPGFSLPDLQGGHVDLSAYRGKLILLDFWATWCDPCRDEVPHFVELQEKYRDQGLQIIGISMDDGPEPVREFFQKYKMNYPVAMGNAKIGEAYGGILGLPIAFLLGRDGRIYSKHIGATDVSVFEKEIVNLLKSK